MAARLLLRRVSDWFGSPRTTLESTTTAGDERGVVVQAHSDKWSSVWTPARTGKWTSDDAPIDSRPRRIACATLTVISSTCRLALPTHSSIPVSRFRWESEPASACSVECGHGEKMQRSYCGKLNGKEQRLEKTDDIHCRDLARPPERVACYSDCAGHRWHYTDWSEVICFCSINNCRVLLQCTVSCGGGVVRREAMCLDGASRRLDDRQCESMPKEATENECNRTPCPRWVYGHWSEVNNDLFDERRMVNYW